MYHESKLLKKFLYKPKYLGMAFTLFWHWPGMIYAQFLRSKSRQYSLWQHDPPWHQYPAISSYLQTDLTFQYSCMIWPRLAVSIYFMILSTKDNHAGYAGYCIHSSIIMQHFSFIICSTECRLNCWYSWTIPKWVINVNLN